MTTIITGPSGVGKTTLAMSFMKEAAGRGERAAIYTFEEWRETLILRCEAVNIPIKAMIDQGTMMVTQVDPIQYTANQFANIIRRDVEEYQTKIVMIDSIAGYRLSLSGGGDLISHLHGLCKYLQSKGVTVILINEIEAITGDFKVTEMGISYLADNIIFMRYIEIDGEMRRMVGVLKKRLSDFEKTMREFQITRYGIKVGQPLNNLQGVLTGTPEKKAQSKV
jgi:circadian clock protein KaiC